MGERRRAHLRRGGAGGGPSLGAYRTALRFSGAGNLRRQARDRGIRSADFEMDPRAFDVARMKPIEVSAGSVIFFGPFLVHRSAPNGSHRDRRALLYSYQPAGNKHLRDILRG
jgi:Phytanoyl-CoA dioxygenase (PhyH)